MMLEIRNIHFEYGNRSVLEDMNLSVGEGEVLSLAGPNGSGKTTLLRCIGGILRPRCGNILLDGVDIGKMNRRELARRLSYVPQNTTLPLPLTVFDTVLLGRIPHMKWKITDRDKDKAYEILQSMKLEALAFCLLNEISGGERQKVFIARAISQEPQVMILDEPTSNLDLRCQLEVLNLISNLAKERGICVVMAMHDLNLAARYSTRMAMMKDGRIHAAGTPDSLFDRDILREVYGVEAEVRNDSACPYVVPIAPV